MWYLFGCDTLQDHKKEIFLFINVTVILQQILDINEVEEAFVTKIETEREWFDNRLTYTNLKSDDHLNVLSENDRELIWSPILVYHNIKNREQVKHVIGDAFNVWNVARNKDNRYQPGDISQPQNSHLYRGSDNKMVLRKQYYIDWICEFDIVWYPFDSQACGMEFYSFNDFTAIRPGRMFTEGPIQHNQYVIKDIIMCSQAIKNKSGLSVVVTLRRPLINNIFTIFTPTILLLGIAHISRVFDEDHPDMVVMVCLTVFLVQASL